MTPGRPPGTIRYRVVATTGCMVDRLRVGAVVYEEWVGECHTHEVLRPPMMAVCGSYTIESEGTARQSDLAWLASRRPAA